MPRKKPRTATDLHTKSSKKIQHVHPKKRLGQHFLRRKDIAEKIVDSLKVGENDTVVEVGAGTGELTRYLVKSGAKVMAVEVDETCLPSLQVLADLNPGMELFPDDVRKLDISQYNDLLIIGNLPYHLSGEILFWMLDNIESWNRAVLTVQDEFAERLVAGVGTHHYSALSVISQTFVASQKLFSIPADAFVPPPKVKSATVMLTPLKDIDLPVDRERYIRFVKDCFTHRRKTLANNLKRMGVTQADEILKKTGHLPTVRPQELSSHDYIELTTTAF